MTVFEGTICLAFLIMFFSIGWFLPRKLGVVGSFLAHIAITILTFAASLFDFIRGVVPDPDFIWLIGNIVWIILANLILLPLTIFATYRYFVQKRAVKNQVDLSTGRASSR